MASILRAAKYNFKGYSTVQAKACDATSNNTQPPTGGQMNELAQLSYNPDDFTEIITVLDKRLDAKGRNWRHVYKSLIVLDYLLHSGSETVIAYYQKNLYVIRTLKEFQYVDEEGKDHGSNVRIKAKDIATLLADESRLREIRRTRAEMRDRMLGRTASTLSSPVDEDLENENVQRRSALAESSDDDSLRLQSAMAQIRQARAAEDRDLLNAMRLSQAFTSDVKVTPPAQEAAPKVESPPAPAAAPIPSTSSQEPDFSMLGASQVSQQLQQPQPSTNDPNLLVVFDGMDQLTAQPAPQFSSYNPFQVQQNLLQQQQDWLQMQAAQQMQQQQELWLHQQYLQQQQQELQQQMQQHAYHKAQFEQPIQPQPTVVYKSNNPFAPTTSPTPSLSSASSSPSIPSPKTPSSPPPPFASSTFSPSDQVSGFTTNSITRKSTNPFPAIDTQHLDNLFATRDDNGMDTFGNFGQLRYGQTFGQIQPAQTAL